jgi:DNA replication protein DnaC
MTDTAAEAAIGAAARELHLPTVRAEAARLAEMAQRSRLSHLAYLAEVLSAEVDERAERRRARRIREARFPRIKRLADFDLAAAPTVEPAALSALASCAFVERGDPMVFLGDSGTGKTHLLIALGTAAAPAGFRVRCALATKLVDELVEAAEERQLAKSIARYGRVDLLCIDDAGLHGT